jgi:hypothetical protein
LNLIGPAAPLGLATGLSAWLLAGGMSISGSALDAVEASLRALHPPRAASSIRHAVPNDLLAAPLFALTTGPGAVREPSIRVDGVSITRQRTAALVSIDGGPTEWMAVGSSQGGVTLQTVSGSGAVFETAVGQKALKIGDQSAASSPAPAAAAGGEPVHDQAPPGVRSPPEPASAPSSR